MSDFGFPMWGEPADACEIRHLKSEISSFAPGHAPSNLQALDARLGKPSGFPGHQSGGAAVRMGTRVDLQLAVGGAVSAKRARAARVSARAERDDPGKQR